MDVAAGCATEEVGHAAFISPLSSCDGDPRDTLSRLGFQWGLPESDGHPPAAQEVLPGNSMSEAVAALLRQNLHSLEKSVIWVNGILSAWKLCTPNQQLLIRHINIWNDGSDRGVLRGGMRMQSLPC